jgi:chromosome segregation ATPase
MNKLFRFGTIVLLAALVAASAPAQTTNPDNATMQKLLDEVRQLRVTLEKSVSLGPRMQLILQRAQLQDARVARISLQLDEVRKQIAAETAEQTHANERLAKIEQDVSAETDAGRRAQLEDMRTALKMAAGNGPDQQLRARESELASSLGTEQAALHEFNEKLDSIERQLEAPPKPR